VFIIHQVPVQKLFWQGVIKADGYFMKTAIIASPVLQLRKLSLREEQ
jgi:hypothetical protein